MYCKYKNFSEMAQDTKFRDMNKNASGTITTKI